MDSNKIQYMIILFSIQSWRIRASAFVVPAIQPSSISRDASDLRQQ
jgi:hypothetical protein